MKEQFSSDAKQRISITGKNWNDIIQLPCFLELKKRGGKISITVAVVYVNCARVGFRDYTRPVSAEIGNSLVEYYDGSWGIER